MREFFIFGFSESPLHKGDREALRRRGRVREKPGREPASNAAMFIVETAHTSGMKYRQNCGGAPHENRYCCSCCSGGCCCGSQHARCLHCCSTSRRADPMTLAQRFAYAANTLTSVLATRQASSPLLSTVERHVHIAAG